MVVNSNASSSDEQTRGGRTNMRLLRIGVTIIVPSLVAVAIFLGSHRADQGVHPASATPGSWQEAWDTGKPVKLHDWFRRNTGPRVPIDPTALTGRMVVTTQSDADRLVGRTVQGSVVVLGNNLRLHDFVLLGDGSPILIEISGNRSGIALENMSIDGQGQMMSQGIGGSSYAKGVTVRSVEIRGVGSDAIRLSNGGVYTNLYIHSLWRWDDSSRGRPYDGARSQSTDPHTDGAQAVRGGGLVEKSWIDNQGVGAENATSAIFIAPNAGPVSGWTIRKNYLNGGGYTIHIHGAQLGTTVELPQNIVIDRNRFGRGYRLGLFSSGDVPPSNITLTDNRWADNLTPTP